MRFLAAAFVCLSICCWTTSGVHGHGTAVSPQSRVWRVFQSNPENPDFELAANAVAIDGTNSYYTWNQVSQNIPEAVNAGLPPGFDYSPWVPDGHIASGGRFSGNVTGLTYEGLDQVSDQWPTTGVCAGETITVDYLATAPHDPSVWDVWMTTADWNPNTALNWNQMEFLGRADATLDNGSYFFDVEIPANRSGHHVMWIAWQRDDVVGEVFFSASDLMVTPVVTPDSLVVNRGSLVSGGVAEIMESDDVDLRIRRNPQEVQSRTEFTVEATSPTDSPTRLDFVFEASVFGRSEVIQSLTLFNYQTGLFELIDSRGAQAFSDLALTISPPGDLTRFVQPGSSRIRARVEFRSTNPRQQFSSNIDHVAWSIE